MRRFCYVGRYGIRKAQAVHKTRFYEYSLLYLFFYCKFLADQNKEVHVSENKLAIVFGPSGSGKGTVLREVCRQHPQVRVTVSHTTRKPRPGEITGKDYHFVLRDEFDQMVAENKFFEWAQYPPETGTCYGTSRAELTISPYPVMEIEIQGVRQVLEKRPDTRVIFLIPPSISILQKRILNRGKDMPQDELLKRLAQAEVELREGPSLAHFVVLNRDGDDGFGSAVNQLAYFLLQ